MASSSEGGSDTPRLLDQVRATIRARRYGRRTEDPYVHWIRRFIVFRGRRHPRELREEDIKAFMTWLTVDLGASAETRDLDGLPASTCTNRSSSGLYRRPAEPPA